MSANRLLLGTLALGLAWAMGHFVFASMLILVGNAAAQDRFRTFVDAGVTVHIELGDDDCVRELRLSIGDRPVSVAKSALNEVCGVLLNAVVLRADTVTSWTLLLPVLAAGKPADAFDSDSTHFDRYEFGFDPRCLTSRVYSTFHRDTRRRNTSQAATWRCGR